MKFLCLFLSLLCLQFLLVTEGARLLKASGRGYDNLELVVARNSKKMVRLMGSVNKKLDRIIKEMEKYSCKNFKRMDFENGIAGWTKTGTAFNDQPTYGDNPTARKRGQPAQQQGHWWVGTYENRPGPSHQAGRVQGDGPTGTLTSPVFRITGKTLTFLIGGGCDIKTERAELLIDGQVVKKETGKCNESMERRYWDVRHVHGKAAQIRLVDYGSGGWGHINFDDLSCV